MKKIDLETKIKKIEEELEKYFQKENNILKFITVKFED